MKTILNKLQQFEFLQNNWKYENLNYSVSRAGVVNLYDSRNKLIHSTSGYGYDKLGACLAGFIKTAFPKELEKLAKSKYLESFYGIRVYNGGASVDGACGDGCMIRIINAIGFNVRHVQNVFLLSPITGSGTYEAEAIKKIRATAK